MLDSGSCGCNRRRRGLCNQCQPILKADQGDVSQETHPPERHHSIHSLCHGHNKSAFSAHSIVIVLLTSSNNHSNCLIQTLAFDFCPLICRVIYRSSVANLSCRLYTISGIVHETMWNWRSSALPEYHSGYVQLYLTSSTGRCSIRAYAARRQMRGLLRVQRLADCRNASKREHSFYQRQSAYFTYFGKFRDFPGMHHRRPFCPVNCSRL